MTDVKSPSNSPSADEVGYSLSATFSGGHRDATIGDYGSLGAELGLFTKQNIDGYHEIGYGLGYKATISADGDAVLHRAYVTNKPIGYKIFQVPVSVYAEGGHVDDSAVAGIGVDVGARLNKTFTWMPGEDVGLAVQAIAQCGLMTDHGWDLGGSIQLMVHFGQTYAVPEE